MSIIYLAQLTVLDECVSVVIVTINLLLCVKFEYFVSVFEGSKFLFMSDRSPCRKILCLHNFMSALGNSLV